MYILSKKACLVPVYHLSAGRTMFVLRIHDVGKYALWIWWGLLGVLPRRAADDK